MAAFRVISSALTDDDRLAPGWSLERLLAELAAISEWFVPASLRAEVAPAERPRTLRVGRAGRGARRQQRLGQGRGARGLPRSGRAGRGSRPGRRVRGDPGVVHARLRPRRPFERQRPGARRRAGALPAPPRRPRRGRARGADGLRDVLRAPDGGRGRPSTSASARTRTASSTSVRTSARSRSVGDSCSRRQRIMARRGPADRDAEAAHGSHRVRAPGPLDARGEHRRDRRDVLRVAPGGLPLGDDDAARRRATRLLRRRRVGSGRGRAVRGDGLSPPRESSLHLRGRRCARGGRGRPRRPRRAGPAARADRAQGPSLVRAVAEARAGGRVPTRPARGAARRALVAAVAHARHALVPDLHVPQRRGPAVRPGVRHRRVPAVGACRSRDSCGALGRAARVRPPAAGRRPDDRRSRERARGVLGVLRSGHATARALSIGDSRSFVRSQFLAAAVRVDLLPFLRSAPDARRHRRPPARRADPTGWRGSSRSAPSSASSGARTVATACGVDGPERSPAATSCSPPTTARCSTTRRARTPTSPRLLGGEPGTGLVGPRGARDRDRRRLARGGTVRDAVPRADRGGAAPAPRARRRAVAPACTRRCCSMRIRRCSSTASTSPLT